VLNSASVEPFHGDSNGKRICGFDFISIFKRKEELIQEVIVNPMSAFVVSSCRKGWKFLMVDNY
jgi:hypothetical protein